MRGGAFEPVLTFAVTGAGLAADAATILVAREAVGDFLARLRSWMTHGSRSETGGEFIVDVSRRSAGADSRLRLVAKWTAADAAPQVDTQALESLLRSVFGDAPPHEKGDAVPPG
jgi:hypothetical protein